MAKRYHAGDLKGAVELQKVLAAADPVVAGLGTCMWDTILGAKRRRGDDQRRSPADQVAGLKAAVNKYFGYGGQTVRSPLPSNGEQKLQAAGSIAVFDQLMKLESDL